MIRVVVGKPESKRIIALLALAAAAVAGCGDEEPTAASLASERGAEAAVLLEDARALIGDEDRYDPDLAETATALRSEREELRAEAEGLEGEDADSVRAELEAISKELGETAKRADELARPHPVGPLRADGLGPVDFGSRSADAMKAFGPPDGEEEVGFGAGPPPRLDWTYRAERDFRVVFDAGLGKLAGYQCIEDCELETETGIGVGDPLASVRREYGSKLEEYPIGVGAFIVPSGGDIGSGGLIFAAEGGDVIAISAFNSLAGPAGE